MAIIILGDLNCNILDDTTDSRTLKELHASFNLTQLVLVIDVIMTTLAESCSIITSSISDYNLIEITLRICCPKVKAK